MDANELKNHSEQPPQTMQTEDLQATQLQPQQPQQFQQLQQLQQPQIPNNPHNHYNQRQIRSQFPLVPRFSKELQSQVQCQGKSFPCSINNTSNSSIPRYDTNNNLRNFSQDHHPQRLYPIQTPYNYNNPYPNSHMSVSTKLQNQIFALREDLENRRQECQILRQDLEDSKQNCQILRQDLENIKTMLKNPERKNFKRVHANRKNVKKMTTKSISSVSPVSRTIILSSSVDTNTQTHVPFETDTLDTVETEDTSETIETNSENTKTLSTSLFKEKLQERKHHKKKEQPNFQVCLQKFKNKKLFDEEIKKCNPNEKEIYEYLRDIFENSFEFGEYYDISKEEFRSTLKSLITDNYEMTEELEKQLNKNFYDTFTSLIGIPYDRQRDIKSKPGQDQQIKRERGKYLFIKEKFSEEC